MFLSLQEDLNAPSPSELVQRVFVQQRDGGQDAQAWAARVEHVGQLFGHAEM